MDIKCNVCGVVKHYKPSAAAEIDPQIYRCRKCFLAASGSRVVACEQCGKERKYDKSHFRKLELKLCRDCYTGNLKSTRTEVTCPRCGKSQMVSPSGKERLRNGSYCIGCEFVYDATIPDTYSAGYIAGATLGDGFLFINKHNEQGTAGYGLRLEVTSPVFANEYAKHLAECCPGHSIWRGFREVYSEGWPEIKMPAGHSYRHIVSINNREWYEKLTPLKHGRKFELLANMGIEFRRGFVQGMIDAEGYINPNYTDVAGKDKELLGVVKDFLGSMGHKARIYGPYPYARGVAHLRVSRPLHKNQ